MTRVGEACRLLASFRRIVVEGSLLTLDRMLHCFWLLACFGLIERQLLTRRFSFLPVVRLLLPSADADVVIVFGGRREISGGAVQLVTWQLFLGEVK
ncbi:MAG: hypothetical protein VX884_02265 [Pseudomonadota bacterium]|nr:hypothetical protein [Pseudomonadota bacterium]